MSTNVKSSSNQKKWYIGISTISIIIMLLIVIIAYACYKQQISSFAAYDPNSNPYIVDSNEDGLQYIQTPSGTNAYISTDSAAYTQKQNMINRGLTALESEGVTSGYVDLESTNNSSSYSLYIILIIIILLFIGSLSAYAAYKESTGYDLFVNSPWDPDRKEKSM